MDIRPGDKLTFEVLKVEDDQVFFTKNPMSPHSRGTNWLYDDQCVIINHEKVRRPVEVNGLVRRATYLGKPYNGGATFRVKAIIDDSMWITRVYEAANNYVVLVSDFVAVDA